MTILSKIQQGNATGTVPSAVIQDDDGNQTPCTDSMMLWQWDSETGWKAPEIRPYGPLAIMPCASVLHYATECFEGIKVYRGHDDALRLLRVRLNCERMLQSSVRTGLPAFDAGELEDILKEFAAHEAATWLPKGSQGKTLYLRPAHIGTTAALGLQKPRHALLYVVATLLPGFSAKGDGMKLRTSPAEIVRAWPGGFGNRKLGANYGATIPPHDDAVQAGFDQVLWLFGREGYVTEAGASNFFVVWKTKEGQYELVTAGLDSGTILEGITRRSILDLAQNYQEKPEAWSISGESVAPLKVVERDFSIDEIREAVVEGRLVEAFAAGTAVSETKLGK